MLIEYDKLTYDNRKMYYEVTDDGFNIYIGQDKRPTWRQYEPFIPDPSKSYEDNAKEMCETFTIKPEEPSNNSLDDRLSSIESNIDYLMLINDIVDE